MTSIAPTQVRININYAGGISSYSLVLLIVAYYHHFNL